MFFLGLCWTHQELCRCPWPCGWPAQVLGHFRSCWCLCCHSNHCLGWGKPGSYVRHQGCYVPFEAYLHGMSTVTWITAYLSCSFMKASQGPGTCTTFENIHLYKTVSTGQYGRSLELFWYQFRVDLSFFCTFQIQNLCPKMHNFCWNIIEKSNQKVQFIHDQRTVTMFECCWSDSNAWQFFNLVFCCNCASSSVSSFGWLCCWIPHISFVFYLWK